MKQQTIEDKFRKILKGVSFLAWLSRALSIPFYLIVADLSAKLITNAIKGNFTTVIHFSLIILVIVLGWKIFSIVLDIIYGRLKEKSIHKCKIELYQHCLALPLSRLYNLGQGEILEHLNDDFNTVTGKIQSDIPLFWAKILTAMVYFIFLAHQNLLIAIIFFIMAMIQMLPPMLVKKFLSQNYKDCRDIEADVTNLTVEGYRGFSTIRMYHLKQWYLDRMEGLHKIYRKISYVSSAAGAMENSLDQLIEYLLKYGASIVSGILILYGIIDIEVGVYSITLSGSLFEAVKAIFSIIPNFAVAKVAKERLEDWDIIEGQDRLENKRRTVVSVTDEEDSKKYQINLIDVTVTWGENCIFQHLNCIFDTRKINVIKGENGIGKSTLLKLIAGLVESKEGRIELGDGIDNFFYLFQERNELDVTGKEFLELMSLKDIKTSELQKAFQLDDALLEQKLNTLSGGEEKRFFLTIGLANKEKLLLLDEPTNSLDLQSRKELLYLLQSWGNGAIIVTHDDIFDEIADCIYTVSKGGICCECN